MWRDHKVANVKNLYIGLSPFLNAEGSVCEITLLATYAGIFIVEIGQKLGNRAGLTLGTSRLPRAARRGSGWRWLPWRWAKALALDQARMHARTTASNTWRRMSLSRKRP
jgi:hypothetical protein